MAYSTTSTNTSSGELTTVTTHTAAKRTRTGAYDAPRGLRPGVRLNRFFEQYEGCYHQVVPSLDTRYERCVICDYSWRIGDPVGPYEPCAVCARKALRAGQAAEKLAIWQMQICVQCGVALCYAHTYWSDPDEDGDPLCWYCKRGHNPLAEAAGGDA